MISSLNTQISQLISNVTSLQDQIASDNSMIGSLTSNITNLQEQLYRIMNGSKSTLDIIISDPTLWVNSTVIVEGSLGVAIFPAFEYAPWDYELGSDSQIIGVSMSASVNMSALSKGWLLVHPLLVRIYGVVEKGEVTFTGGPSEITYYIEAETVEPL